MSEAEIKRRLAYKKNRKKWTIIQACIIAMVTIILAVSVIAYFRISETYYIEYTENSKVDYQVQLKENDFYDDEWINKDQAYISELMSNIIADFEYKLDMMEAANVKYSYSYYIQAQIKITNKQTGTIIYAPVFDLIGKESAEQSNNNHLTIDETVLIDYNKYNDIVKSFVNTYQLKQATSALVVTMYVDVTGSCDAFQSDSVNSYSVSLNIPLNVDTVEINTSASAPAGETHVLACSTSVNKDAVLVIAIIAGVLDLILIIVLVIFIWLTVNEDITYSNKVKKILSSYSSFIQRIENDFDIEGYQVLEVKSFKEMLAIRDTIQSPVLMCENRDQTLTRFVIPTNTHVLYTFVIKVDNYDEIYGTSDNEPVDMAFDDTEYVEEEHVEIQGEYIEETVILEENVDEVALEEALAMPDVVLEEIEYDDSDDEEYEGSEEEPGIEVVGVVWPERAHKNKIYRYDPNGEKLSRGDVVLVPSRDEGRKRDIIRKAAVAHANHKADPDQIEFTLKKIIGVVKRKAEHALTSNVED